MRASQLACPSWAARARFTASALLPVRLARQQPAHMYAHARRTAGRVLIGYLHSISLHPWRGCWPSGVCNPPPGDLRLQAAALDACIGRRSLFRLFRWVQHGSWLSQVDPGRLPPVAASARALSGYDRTRKAIDHCARRLVARGAVRAWHAGRAPALPPSPWLADLPGLRGPG